jgi:hypothetical protein
MADQSTLSRYTKKQLLYFAEKLIDNDFDFQNLYNNYEENYSIASSLGKYFSVDITDEDVQFLSKFLEINDDILSQIFGGDRSLIENLEIPIAKDYEIEYTTYGTCVYTEYYTTKISCYDRDWVDNTFQRGYDEGYFEVYDGNLENTVYDNHEMSDWEIQKVNLLESKNTKTSLLGKLVLENTQDALNSLDKDTLLKLRTLINSRLSNL